jgi:diguanylate cyclase (GGDEF)-like protein/PAS domain S-box-containing protein
MSSLFQGQMDYIFFFYGLSFVGLGVVCYILSKEVGQRLQWKWLALFGLTHGLHEWLNLLTHPWETGVWFAICRWVLMAASFLFLLEFARRSLRRQEQGQGRWVLGVLVLIAAVGALAGLSGLRVTTRYALGLMGGLGAGWALCTEARQTEPRYRFWLLAGGMGLLLYGLATGVIVGRASFFPATVVNYETFTSLTGLPIQVVRGVLAAWVAVMLWGYFQVSWAVAKKPRHRFRSRYLYGVNLALIIILATGWLLTQYLGNVARQKTLEDTAGHGDLIIQRLTFELEGADAAAKAMSGSPWIRPVLLSKSPAALAKANSVLDRYQSRFAASPAYIMDPTGTVVASSNRQAPDSFVGHNYGFRPYFQKALTGHPGRYFALGVTSKKRGFYAAYPVRGPTGKIVGVASIKTTLDDFLQELQECGPAFLVDPQGIIFLSNRPNLNFHSFWPVTGTGKARLQAQYGTAKFAAMFPGRPKNGSLVKVHGASYLFYRRVIDSSTAPGWSLVLLASVKMLTFYRLLGIATAFIIVVLLLIYAGTTLSIREGVTRIQASESRFRAMFDAAPEAVFVFDPETHRIVSANPFMAQWLGYDLEELIGMEIEQIRTSGSPGPQGEGAGESSEEPNSVPGLRYRKKNGLQVDVECTRANIYQDDQLREIVFVRDITQRKKVAADLVWEAMVNSAMADLSKSLMTSLPLEQIASLVYEHAVNLTGSKLGFCGYINPQTGTLVIPVMTGEIWAACHIGDKSIEFHDKSGFWGWVLEHGQSLLTNHPDQIPGTASPSSGNTPIHRFLSVPAMINGKLVGQIALANAERDYSPRDQEICERLALIYAQAIHRQRLDETLRESETGLKTILDNVQTGILIVNPETSVIVDANPVALEMIGRSKEQIVGSDCHKFIWHQEEDQHPLTDLHEAVNNSEKILRRADGSNRWIIETVVPVSLQGQEYLLESFMDITERREWEEAVQTSNEKLQNLVAQVEEQNRIMMLTNEMADLMQVCQTSEEAYVAIEQFMPQFFPEEAGSLYMLNNSRNLFEVTASWGEHRPAVPAFAPEDCWSVRRGRLHKVDDPKEALLCHHVSQLSCGGYLCVPLIAQGETLGVLFLQWACDLEGQKISLAMSKEQLALVVAEDLALALANLRLRETLRSQAIRDPLTGLFNRRYMEETLERELKRAQRTGTSIAVIMMDLDRFKLYNDTFGHSAGDEILSALGNLVRGEVRGEDIACRYGGEEFLLIIPGACQEVAKERAELLRQAVKEMHIHHNGLKSISLSLGVAVYPTHGETGLELIRAADMALYQAKNAGRDRVMMAADHEENLNLITSDMPIHSQTDSA